MDIISSSNSTVLSGFPQLETKYTYEHDAKNEINDFQFFAKKHLFIAGYKNYGLDFLRIQESPENENSSSIISRVRKIRMDNLHCIACPKQCGDDVALGLSNGEIKLLNYKTSELANKFKAENSRNSVLSLDFNASDEYLSSVYENGIVKIYGIKTKVKLESLSIDSTSTLGRFHPTKKFHLSIASHNGSVFIYDIQTKRKLFQSVHAHAAPCRDLCMSLSQPDILLSVGFDCYLNLYDTRKKNQLQKIKCEHPLSAVAISNCGFLCCVGSLKGEIITYDLRYIKDHLAFKKLYKTNVVRIGFVSKDIKYSPSILTTTSTFPIHDEIKNSIGNNISEQKKSRDSFCDFLDFHYEKAKEDKLNSRHSIRESFDWNMLKRSKVPVNNCNSKENLTPKSLEESDNFSPLLHKKQSKISKDGNSRNKLTKVKENEIILGEIVETNEKEKSATISTCKEKETNESAIALNELIPSLKSLPTMPSQISDHSNVNIEILKQLQDIRLDFEKKFQALESDLKFDAETNKWQIFTQNFNLWNEQKKFNCEIRESMEYLLKNDEFCQEFLRLKEENEKLKLKLLQLRRK